ncbi:uncharacterized protein ACLA_042840 [Aspergillus clavatus NRRL 1]|uniref:DUF3752 domain-containing protein n=1 Tax=Aspergillus clavatus (strain ATCC 1007 / CBS 513.65 / DSM 816 / NCTC 3887 / NRRL 1 / QM 1276 / 107) TaxID=344612 RepID=A1C8C9_ASPCL|nr:uncharacterized protein ACLA_042840 [Aspergillus clavatus NRRL 1]EAW13566.1 conserved hypothetical protein [Aspergillus clavatus NRRL 1]
MAQHRETKHGLYDRTDTVMVKRRKVVGPTLPSLCDTNKLRDKASDDNGSIAALNHHNDSDQDSDNDEDREDEEDDDSYGPSLPPLAASTAPTQPQVMGHDTSDVRTHDQAAHGNGMKRDEWMLQPPQSPAIYANHLPTKLENRKFQGGKSANKPPNAGVDASWTETPEQRLKRLQDEAMGLSPTILKNGCGPGSRTSRRVMGLDQNPRPCNHNK